MHPGEMTTISRAALNRPLLMLSFIDGWPCRSWTFQGLATVLGDQAFSCRIAPKSCGQKMETQCAHQDVTVKQFCDWLYDRPDLNNPLRDISRKDNSCYIDYKYMKDMFRDHPEMFEQVQWKDFGLCGFDGYDSTIWLASEGANTPGHQDSYGYNLVTQIYGRKLWILFPPEDSGYLYATRVPYEESSIFTQVNIRKPDFRKHPKFKLSHPVVVTLSPGQTLYVPRHWWHYVESLEPSISVNLWVPMREDRGSRLHEAITRCLATSLITTLDTSDDSSLQSKWLNPTESLAPASVNLLLLKTALYSQLLGDADCGDGCAEKDEGQDEETEKTGEDVKDSDPRSSVETESVSCLESKSTFMRLKNVREIESKQTVKETGQAFTQVSKEYDATAGTDESYLDLFAENIKSCTCVSVTSPFQYDTDDKSLSSKRKTDSQTGASQKRLKNESGSCIESLLSSSSVSCKGTDSKIFSIHPCSIDTYVDFMDSLCEKVKCKQCQEHLRYSTTVKDCDGQRTGGKDSVFPDSSNILSARNELASVSSGKRAFIDRRVESGGSVMLPQPTSGGDEQYVSSGHQSDTQDNSSKRAEGAIADETVHADVESDLVFNQLSSLEVAETLLNCALHPDVVDKISVLFREQCEHRLRQKSKQRNT